MLGTTPMFIQYHEIKQNHQDCILFYRLGDFYEMFGPDALKASKILQIALTSRDSGGGEKVPMCGIPYHAAEGYIGKLIAAGEKIAICEQVEDPKEVKGLVKRDVVRIITPGTVLEDGFLQDGSNYLMSIYLHDGQIGICFLDVSTGDYLATEVEDEAALKNEFWRYEPVEVIYATGQSQARVLLAQLVGEHHIQLNDHGGFAFAFEYAEGALKQHFSLSSLKGLGYEQEKAAICAAGGLLDYVSVVQKKTPQNLRLLKIYSLKEYMNLDYATKRNLELTKSLFTSEKEDSLLEVLDHTCTAPGRRLLKSWLEKPLLDEQTIRYRQAATAELFYDAGLRGELKAQLEPIYDLARIVSRIAFNTANAKDLIALKASLYTLPKIQDHLTKAQNPYFKVLGQRFDNLADIYNLLEESISEEAPFSLREGNLIKNNYNNELDELRDILQNGQAWLDHLEAQERQTTGIKNLKIGFNRVFGYYIDVTKSNLANVPAHYIRRQTLANSERFFTEELKEMEEKIVGADERQKELEYQLFTQVRTSIQGHMDRLLETAQIIAQLDVIYSFAQAAVVNHWCQPDISITGDFVVEGLRHPIVEKKLKQTWFIPNDVYFDQDQQRFLIITGPNMSGKSTYCRSIALAVILFQIGSFIPAKKGAFPIIDRVFARIGASDDLSTGQSTFMVEMNEVANIINNATKDSLIILDEVGRGTSTYDGLAIAWSITEYLSQVTGARCLFATHYHELTVLAGEYGIKNFSVAVHEQQGDIVFLHKIVPGAADRSYGIHVAKLAGLPKQVLKRANTLLAHLEEINSQRAQPLRPLGEQGNLTDCSEYVEELEQLQKALCRITDLELTMMTPLEALNTLSQVQKELATITP